MKFASQFALAVAVVSVIGFTSTSAKAFEVEYSYPQQSFIETQTVETTHPLNCAKAEAGQIDAVIHFANNNNKLSKEAVAKVKKVAAMLKSPEFAGSHVVVTGYTDNVGKDSANQRLSYHRALAVAHALVAHGVPATMLSAQGIGSADPVATNTTAEGRAANRRVTFTVSAQ
jgi:hypothetical protein